MIMKFKRCVLKLPAFRLLILPISSFTSYFYVSGQQLMEMLSIWLLYLYLIKSKITLRLMRQVYNCCLIVHVREKQTKRETYMVLMKVIY